jgi:hypothetical protein
MKLGGAVAPPRKLFINFVFYIASSRREVHKVKDLLFLSVKDNLFDDLVIEGMAKNQP